MLDMKLAQAKTLFFDRAKIEQAADRAQAKVHSQFGAFVRQRARSSIRRSKKSSEPGKPPRAHGKALLKRNIVFVKSPGSVIIGAVRLNGRTGSLPAPKILEHGGTTTIDHRRATYKPRPFMAPAAAAELPKLPALWQGAIK